MLRSSDMTDIEDITRADGDFDAGEDDPSETARVFRDVLSGGHRCCIRIMTNPDSHKENIGLVMQ